MDTADKSIDLTIADQDAPCDNRMTVLYKSIGMTNPEGNEFVFQTPPKEAEEFIRHLIKYTLENRRTRTYRFAGDRVVKQTVVSYARAADNPLGMDTGSNLDTYAESIAQELLEAERIPNAKLKATGTRIRNGNLVLALVRDEKRELYFVIAKVDHMNFFDGVNLEQHPGFPGENNNIWKTAVIQINERPEISVGDVLIYMDRPAKFWTSGFLSLAEVRTDAMNSKLMYRAVIGVLKRQVEGVSANDFLLLCATLTHRMHTEGTLDYVTFINEFIDAYKAQDPRLGEKAISALKKNLLSLPEKCGFDRQFNVDPSDIAAMENKQTIPIADGIELTISDRVTAPRNLIKTYEDEDGTRYLMIRCWDTAYDKFR